MSSGIQYNKEQLKAIEHEYGNLQIIACAGSGKTEVISNKVAKLSDLQQKMKKKKSNYVVDRYKDTWF